MKLCNTKYKKCKIIYLLILPVFFLLFPLVSSANLLDQIDSYKSNDLFLFDDPFSNSIDEQYSFDDNLMLVSGRSKKGFLNYQNYLEIEKAIRFYQDILYQGGWPSIDITTELEIGDVSEEIKKLRERLLITKDIDQDRGISDIFDVFVAEGLKNFQSRHGLEPTGRLDKNTIEHLNHPVEYKLKKLGINKTRFLNYISGLGERYIFVNIPGGDLAAVDNGIVDYYTKVIVGKSDRQTPILESGIYEINFFPYWHVPESIVKKDIIRAMNIDPRYLEKNNIFIYQDYYYQKIINPKYIDWTTEEATLFKFRQNPGFTNSLGVAKINFPNEHAVFLHDTPRKSLFNEEIRYFSSGCVRVQNIDDLINWLLSESDNWNEYLLHEILNSSVTKTLRLDSEIPIKIGYLTAWVENGQIQFRDDIYKKDSTY